MKGNDMDIILCFASAQVLRVVPQEAWQVGYLQALQRQDLYDFWTEPRSIG